jgi:hypothetical protein
MREGMRERRRVKRNAQTYHSDQKGSIAVNSDATDLQQIREYLLGRLPRDQQPVFEERLLVDSVFYEELLIVEDEIVDEYLQGAMSSADRVSFESHFIAAPEHQEKVRFSRAFKKYLSSEASAHRKELSALETTRDRSADVSHAETTSTADSDRKSRWFGFLPVQNPTLAYALAFAVLLVVVGTGWWATRTFLTSREPGRVFAVTLTPGLTRGEGQDAVRFPVSSDVDTLRLQLLVSDDHYNAYEASLIDSDGRVLATENNLKPQTVEGRMTVVLDVDSRLVPANDYRVKLNRAGSNGPEPVATYTFRVQSK